MRPYYQLQNEDGKLTARITGPPCCVTGFCPVTFNVSDDSGNSVGKIQRKNGKDCFAAVNCCCCPAVGLESNFDIPINPDVPQVTKAQVAAVRIYEEYGFFREDLLCELMCLPCTDGELCKWSLNMILWLCDCFCIGCRWPVYLRIRLPVECNPCSGEGNCCGAEYNCCECEFGECCDTEECCMGCCDGCEDVCPVDDCCDCDILGDCGVCDCLTGADGIFNCDWIGDIFSGLLGSCSDVISSED